MVDLGELAQRLIEGNAAEVDRLTKEAIQEGRGPAEILEGGLIAGMTVIGVRFKNNEIFVPEVLVAARAMKAGLAHLEPILSACGIPPAGKFVIGTVRGDIHDIGKNLVGMMLRGAGFQVIDLGVNTSLQKFLAAIQQHKPDILGMSALLTTTMGQMKTNIEAFHNAGLLEDMRVMVGGAPVSENYAAATGAHGYARDATQAVERAVKLLAELKAERSRRSAAAVPQYGPGECPVGEGFRTHRPHRPAVPQHRPAWQGAGVVLRLHPLPGYLRADARQTRPAEPRPGCRCATRAGSVCQRGSGTRHTGAVEKIPCRF